MDQTRRRAARLDSTTDKPEALVGERFRVGGVFQVGVPHNRLMARAAHRAGLGGLPEECNAEAYSV